MSPAGAADAVPGEGGGPAVLSVGARLPRADDPRLLSGRGRYVDDLTFPRMVFAAMLRSPHAHARILSLDVEAARRGPGVVAVLTGEDAARLCKPYRGILQHYAGMKTGAMLPLARERVRYVGEPVVAIAARDRAAAEDALELVRVEYEPLPAVLSPDAATADGAPLIHPELGDNVLFETRLAAGDTARAFAEAHRTWTRTFRIGRHTGVPIEARALVADFDPTTRSLTVWMSTQVPHMMQAVLADLLSLPEHRVRVVTPDVGGSFGIKIHVYQDDLAAIELALVLGRPVKFVADRRESLISDIHAREQTVQMEVAATAGGVVTAMRAAITAAVGPYSAYPRSSVVEGGQVLRLLPGPYRVRHYDASLRVVAQNKVITSQYRAVGHPIATLVTEAMLDVVARDLGIDPAEVRRRNLVPAEAMPYASVTGNVYDSGRYHETLERLLDAAGYTALRADQASARAAGRHVGIGISCFVELTGPGAQFYGVGGAPISGQESVTVRVEPSGVVTALTGLTDQGQGMPTALAQIIAGELGIAPDAVHVRWGDTAAVPYGGGTWASRGMPIGGSAALLAARALASKIKSLAAVVLEASPDDVTLHDGRAHVVGSPERGLTLEVLARTVYFRSNELRGAEPGLDATAHFANAQPWTFTNGAHLAVVEVDAETGVVTVVKYVAVDDCGRMVNPALVEGQVRGGVVQGIGGALYEECVYDETGQPLATTLLDYVVPSSAEIPAIEVHHLETPAPGIPGGFKGAGEGGTAGAPAAIVNAVNDALAPLGVAVGDCLTEQPLTPERVRRAVRARLSRTF